ncbi:MAG: hypothetical protein Q4B45_01115 [Coriobacteriia bacterium]|nr:hypothetical protein [Coriobacteriia bacterium]
MGTGNSGYEISGTAGAADAGYTGGTRSHHSMADNKGALTSKYPITNGYFGSKGSTSNVRRIESDNPISTAADFYGKAAKGGIEKPMPNGKGVMTCLSDGTIITMRRISSSDGSPAVDINISKSNDPAGIKRQKIHFLRRRNEGD